ncbi:cytochrome c oxidase subunit 6A1, mitochondrial-like [Oppia nitens]|uniref:cytochrome c oxidase subunit 6A1, mitochondrial-like n=1 Tax=Oppia nitens TaxID=1686743 RepID=UPI0023DAC5DD|nr:cytochrome c oxidase subunit 6A1, mitochondrial-like [Oppia nitens]
MVLSKLPSRVPTVAHQLLLRSAYRYLSTASSHAKHEPNPDLWKKLFIFVCIPAIGLSGLNTYLVEKEHHEHFERPEFKQYEYMRIRTKPFPWGDGQRSLFHNPMVNPLPDGWEELPDNHKKH